MAIYEELGVRRVINGAATLTRWGGSVMPSEVVQAMVDAAAAFVDLDDLQQKVGDEIARLTHNEAAYVSSGCAAAMVLATAACITGTDDELRQRLPFLDGLKNEVIVHRATRVPYDFCIRQVGVKLVEIGDEKGAVVDDLKAALSDKTAAMFFFPNANRDGHTIPLGEAIEVCHRHDVPVLVDGAAQIPPVCNLWKWTRDEGADLAMFSGGKGLRGPQAAGVAVGRKDLIAAMRGNGAPNQLIGRPMKVGKEEMCGMLAAVRWYLRQDEESLLRHYEDQVTYLVDEMQVLPGVSARRSFPSEAGQPMPRAEIILDPSLTRISRDEVLQELLAGDPPIYLFESEEHGILINPQTLYENEHLIVTERLTALLTKRHGS